MADVLRDWTREDRRGFRVPGGMAEPSGTARLAGNRIRPRGLGYQGDAEADRHERHLSPVLESASRNSPEGSRESAAGSRVANPVVCGDDSRSGAGRVGPARRAGWRSVGEALSTRRTLEG